MPKKVVVLENLEYTIERPIITSIVSDIKKILFKRNDIYTTYNNNYEDSNFDSTKNTYDNTTHKERLEIGTELIPTEELALTNTVLRRNIKPIFLDRDIELSVAPNTVNHTGVLTFKLITKSKNYLVSLLNKLRVSAMKDSYRYQHTVEYYYTVPKDLLYLLKNINNLKNGLDTNYYNYLNTIGTVPIDYINSKTKKYSIPAIKEKQSIIGTFTTDLFSEKKIDKDEHGWYIDLEYTFDIDMPNTLLVLYPLLVNNKLIDKKLIPEEDIITIIESSSNIIEAFANLKKDFFTDIRNSKPIINYPVFDDFVPRMRAKPFMVRLLSTLITADIDAPNDLLSMEDYTSIFINNKVADYLKNNEGKSLFSPMENIFHIELFENSNLVDYGLYLENDIIKSTIPLKQESTYRLVLNVVYNLDFIIFKDVINRNELSPLLDILKSINIRYIDSDDGKRMMTVMISYILTTKVS